MQLRFDLILALVSFLFPLGWAVSGFPPNILLACACWALTLALLLHAFWISALGQKIRPDLRASLCYWVAVGIALAAWGPVSREYRKEYGPPSFAFVFPGVVLNGDSWLFILAHRGTGTLHEVEVVFDDLDLRASFAGRTQLSQEELDADPRTFRFGDVGPYGSIWAKQFQWKPFNLSRSHFSAIITHLDGVCLEDLHIRRCPEGSQQQWEFAATVTEDAPEKRILLACRDVYCNDQDESSQGLPPCWPDWINKK